MLEYFLLFTFGKTVNTNKFFLLKKPAFNVCWCTNWP